MRCLKTWLVMKWIHKRMTSPYVFVKITQRSAPEGSVSCAELGKSPMETQENTLLHGVWPMVRSLVLQQADWSPGIRSVSNLLWFLKDKTPRRSIIGIKGYIWSSEDPESPQNPNLVSSPKKRKLCKMSAVDLEDEMTVKRVKSCRAGKGSVKSFFTCLKS